MLCQGQRSRKMVVLKNVGIHFYLPLCKIGDMRGRSWLRRCATNRKVAGLIPDSVIILPVSL
jgi:hypothetical protein